MLIVLLLALAAVTAAEPAVITGAVAVTVLDRSGAMVTDLRAEEVTLKEDGQTRAIVRVERDTRPLALAVLMDTSELMGKGFVRELTDPIMDYLESWPANVDRTLLAIGTPPEVVPLGDPVKARATLKAKAPFGKLSLYDGIAEACDRLARKQGTRRAVVVILSDRFSESEEDRHKAMEAVARAMPLVLAVQFQGAGTYAPGVDAITQWTGGRYEQIGSTSGVASALKKLLPELEAPWIVVYETPGATAKRKVEVKVSRKGTRAARVRAAGLD